MNASADHHRVDALDKVTGRAAYTGDLSVPGMLHGHVVRSPHPHARIVSIDTRATASQPDVAAVVTSRDLAEGGVDPYYGNIVRDRPVLATDVVRFAGEPVAIVVASTHASATAAGELIEVSYEPLPMVGSMQDALGREAVRLHVGPYQPGGISGIRVASDLARNVCHRTSRRRGDVDAIFRAASHVFDAEFRFPAVYQYALEPHATLAAFDDGQLQVWSSAQHPFAIRRELARIFRLPLKDVRVVVPYLGGGFGSKSWTKIEPLAAAAAWKARRPVRLVLSVPEAMQTSRRHNAEVRVRTAVDDDGKLLARAVDIRLDTGAYADNGPQVAESSLDVAVAPYRIPDYTVEATAVYTNTVPAGSMRAIGAPQVSWACEAQLDEVARELGLDPVDLRHRNLAQRGDIVFDGLKPADADLAADLDRLVEASGPPGRLPSGRQGRVARGRGVAVATTGAGASPVATALVRLHADGSVTVLTGSTEIGQGSRTALCRIAARTLGVDPTRVRFAPADTDFTPYDQSTGGSRTTTVVGSAVVKAAEDLLAQLRQIAAAAAGLDPAELHQADGGIEWTGGRAAFEDLIEYYFGTRGGELVGRGYSGRNVPDSFGAHRPIFWEVAMAAADVAVDLDTGEITVERYTALADAGHVVNPTAAEGQEEGAVVMGLGSTLMEEMRFVGGRLENASLLEYRVPTVGDAPRDLRSILVENGDGPGPFGARGIGEASVVPSAGAVAAAFFWATGTPVRELPLTPQRVWRLLSG